MQSLASFITKPLKYKSCSNSPVLVTCENVAYFCRFYIRLIFFFTHSVLCLDLIPVDAPWLFFTWPRGNAVAFVSLCLEFEYRPDLFVQYL